MKVIAVLFFLLGIHRHVALDIHAAKPFARMKKPTTKVNKNRRALSTYPDYYYLWPAGYTSECPEGASVPQDECWEAALLFENTAYFQARTHSLEYVKGPYPHTPCGCFLWDHLSEQNIYTTYFDNSTTTCNAHDRGHSICKVPIPTLTPYLLSAGAVSECPEGTSVPQEDCWAAAQTLIENSDYFQDLTIDKPFLQVEDWSHTPCGCFLWEGEIYAGKYWIDFDTSTTGCGTDPRGHSICTRPTRTPITGSNLDLRSAGSTRICPEGASVLEEDCLHAAKFLFENSDYFQAGTIFDEVLHMTTAGDTPCGCHTYTLNNGATYYASFKTSNTNCFADSRSNSICTFPEAKTFDSPTASPTSNPTASPTSNPTASPNGNTTANPTSCPTASPTGNPTASPTGNPTASPTGNPTSNPTASPTGNPTASPTSSSYPTDQGITNINHHSIDNVKCVGKITNDTFVPSVTCSASKFSETKAVMEMKQGNCTGIELVRIENTANDTISVNSGSVDKYINGTNQAFVFCLVVQTFIGNDTEVITEGKTEGTVILNRDLSGEFSLEVSMEAYTTKVTSLDDVAGNSVALIAYQCKNDYSEILNPTEKPQGSTLSVCIVTDQGTSVSLTDVSMEISPSTPNAFTITPIITSDKAVNSVLTTFNSHSDGNKVQVKTILVSKYFADTSKTIVVSGTANYNYSSERERRLRILQSIDDEDISPFDLKIDLKANEAGIFQLSSSTAYNLFHVYGMSALMTCVVTFSI